MWLPVVVPHDLPCSSRKRNRPFLRIARRQVQSKSARIRKEGGVRSAEYEKKQICPLHPLRLTPHVSLFTPALPIRMMWGV
jgi:hypothetical protein